MRPTRFTPYLVCVCWLTGAVLPWPAIAKAFAPSDGTPAASTPGHKGKKSRAGRSSRAAPPDGGHAKDGRQHGIASFYSRRLAGKKTASGASYDPKALTAAHRTLPLGTKVKVVNPKNERSVVVTVNDRGPVPKNRMIDVSGAAAEELGMKKSGVTKVETEVVGKTVAATR